MTRGLTSGPGLAVVRADEVAGVRVRSCGSCSWFRWGNVPTYCSRGMVEMAPSDGCTRWSGDGGRVAGGTTPQAPRELGGRPRPAQENE